MPNLYRHKRHGWEIKYKIHYLDGSSRHVSKFAKKKTKALDIFGDAKKLETLSRKQSIHKDEAIYFRNLKLINDNDYHKIIGLPAPASLSWDTLKALYLSITIYLSMCYTFYKPYKESQK